MEYSIQQLFDKYDYGVEPDKQQFVRDNYSKLTILDLAKYAFSKDDIDNRSPEVRKIKLYIQKIKKNLSYLELTEDQRRLVEENATTMGAVEIARYIFDNPALAPLSKESQTVDKFIKVNGWKQDPLMGDKRYSAPKAYSLLIRKVNNSKPDLTLDEKTLTIAQRRNLDYLRNCLQSPRFRATIDAIRSTEEKELFEAEFINGVYDKELNSEELNMYITLCSDYVLMKQIKRQLDILNDELEASVEDEDRSIKMTLTEAFGKKAKEYDDCAKRLKSLQEALSSNRANRMKNQTAANGSLTAFVEAWKDEDGRKRMLLIAKAREKEILEEMDKIESAEEYIAHVMGISKSEILNT
jgi:hypothetical protein